MPISYSAAMPPWVGQPADPAAHYAQGFQIGVHVGAQQAANAFQQQQVALQQQRQLMAQQQQEVENQMQAQVLSLKASEMAQKHQANMAFQTRIASGEDPNQVLMQLAPELGRSATTALHEQRMRDEFVQNMALRKANLNRLQKADAARLTPKPTAAERERADLTNLQRQAAQLETSLKNDPTNTDLKAKQLDVQNQIQTWYTQHPGGQQISLTSDASGNVQISMGTGKIQPGAQAAVQKEMADLKNSVVQTKRARSLVTEKDVGVPGLVWDEVANKWLSQIAGESGDPNVAANRVYLQKAVDSYLQTQTEKGRLSKEERAEIRNALVSRKAGESLPRARAILDAMSRIQQFDAITKAKSIHQGLEPWMFDGLKQSEIKQLLDEQILTGPEALEWAKKATSR